MTSTETRLAVDGISIPRPARTVLLNPGPVNVDERVRDTLSYPDVCHREPEVADLMRKIRHKIAAVCGGTEEHTAVVLGGSGTAALEATISSVVPETGRLLILDNGHYGERVHDIAAVHGVPFQRLEFGWANPIDLQRVVEALENDLSITHVALVHHETSTGMLNPLLEVGEVVASHGVSLIVDAISSLGAETLDIVAHHVEWCVGTANKCLEGLPGASFVVGRTASFAALRDIAPRGYYLSLSRHFEAQEYLDAPAFTPPVQILYALDRALDLVAEEGVPGRCKRYADRAAQLREGLAARGMRFLLEPEHRCNSVTNVQVPDGVTYTRLHDTLKADGYIVYACQDELGRVFRIANMGQVTSDDISGFLLALDRALPGAAP